MNVKNKIEKEILVKYYIDENKTLKELSKILNRNIETISKYLKEYGIKKDRSAYILSYKWNEERKRNLSLNNPMKNPENIIKAKQTKLEKYGDNYNNIISEKSFKTYKEKTGLNNPFQDVENIQQSLLKKYNCSNSNYIPGVKEKIKQAWEKVDKVKLASKKKETCLKKYGTNAPAQNTNIQNKIKETCLKKYGVECIFLKDNLKYNIKSKHSKPNDDFAKLLELNNINYIREFVINSKSYDFKIGKYLLEINPSATHNINWSPYGDRKGLDILYHFKKSKLAEANGYVCIQIFDWMDKMEIINKLKTNKEIEFIQLQTPRCFVYNLKTKKYDINPNNISLNKYDVIIYDDGKIFK